MSETVRYGVIGTGLMGIEHIHNLQALPGAEIVAVADPDQNSLNHAKSIVDSQLKFGAEWSRSCSPYQWVEIGRAHV